MDNNKHNDWTGAVRERLDGRELTPSDALWERIGAAAPQAAAPPSPPSSSCVPQGPGRMPAA